MRKLLRSRALAVVACMLAAGGLFADSRHFMNAGAGYFGDNIIKPGAVGVFELDRDAGEGISVPTIVSAALFKSPDYFAAIAGVTPASVSI